MLWLLPVAASAQTSPSPVPAGLPGQLACDSGDAGACLALANAYAEAEGVPKDPFRASQLYRRGCDLGHAEACMFLAEAYRTGNGTRADQAVALDLYVRACELKNGLACRSVGDLYTMGTVGLVDGKSAGVWYRMGCDLGDAQACTAAGLWVERGDGAAIIDLPTSVQLFERGCLGGHLRACTLLAERAERGSDGLAKDPHQAIEWYAKACVAPFDPQGCRELGRAQLAGKLLPADLDAGLLNLDRACYQNDAIACRYLSLETYRRKQDQEALLAGERGCDLGDDASCRAADKARLRLMR